ncbi:hypothetical protein KJ810_02520 [Patescibacteria group bacterium]|nr:hypothetical protein [Patescibacteria group bacterium]
MEDQKNKNNSPVSVKVSSGKKDDEEKNILKGAKILIKDQKGKFSYVEGAKLLGEDKVAVTAPPSQIPEESTIAPSIVQKAVAQLTKQEAPVSPEPFMPKPEPVPEKELEQIVSPRPASPLAKPMPGGPPLPIPQKEDGVKQVTASQMKSAIESRKVPNKGVNASFYFDVEDEEDVQKIHKKKISSVPSAIDYSAVVKEIADQAGVRFSEELLQKRFGSLIMSRLRDIRTSVQLRELLARSKKVGGLELDLEKVDQIVKATDEKAKTFHDNDTIKTMEMRQRMKMQEAEKEKTQQEKMRGAVAHEQIKKAVLDLQKKNEFEKEIEPAPLPEPIPQEPKKKKFAPIIPKMQRPMPEFDNRPKIVDIKTPSRLMGPVEEIRSLNLVDFRRLGENPQEAIGKIKEKVDLLEEESFTKKAEAIQAWKKSEIYQIYLDIGNEGMNKSKSVQDVITSRKMDGRSYLTNEEFEAVGDLNKQLRF